MRSRYIDEETIERLAEKLSDLFSTVVKLTVYKEVFTEKKEAKTDIEKLEKEMDDLVKEALMLPLPVKNINLDKENKKIIIEIGD